RYQSPREVAEALAPWVSMPIPPPPESEMPRLSPKAMGLVGGIATSPPGANPPARVPAAPSPVQKAPEFVVDSPPQRSRSSKAELDCPRAETSNPPAPFPPPAPAEPLHSANGNGTPTTAPSKPAPSKLVPPKAPPPRSTPSPKTISLPAATVEAIENSP